MNFDPFAQVTKALEAWQKIADESISRTASFYDEIGKLEAKGLERTEHAMNEGVKLTKESIAYGAQLGAEWRKLSLESMQRAVGFFQGATTAAR